MSVRLGEGCPYGPLWNTLMTKNKNKQTKTTINKTKERLSDFPPRRNFLDPLMLHIYKYSRISLFALMASAKPLTSLSNTYLVEKTTAINKQTKKQNTTAMPYLQKSKWVWSGNTTITHCRPTHGTMRKCHRTLTVTRHQPSLYMYMQ